MIPFTSSLFTFPFVPVLDSVMVWTVLLNCAILKSDCDFMQSIAHSIKAPLSYFCFFPPLAVHINRASAPMTAFASLAQSQGMPWPNAVIFLCSAGDPGFFLFFNPLNFLTELQQIQGHGVVPRWYCCSAIHQASPIIVHPEDIGVFHMPWAFTQSPLH